MKVLEAPAGFADDERKNKHNGLRDSGRSIDDAGEPRSLFITSHRQCTAAIDFGQQSVR
ncbi:MAG: hypothetical protein ACRED7_05100 [Stellaceae bacterium]